MFQIFKRIARYFDAKFKIEKSEEDLIREEIMALDSNESKNWHKLADLYLRLRNGYAIRSAYLGSDDRFIAIGTIYRMRRFWRERAQNADERYTYFRTQALSIKNTDHDKPTT